MVGPKVWWLDPWPRRMRARLGDRTIIDSIRVQALHRPGELMSLWFPRDDIELDALPADAITDPDAGDERMAKRLYGYVLVRWDVADRWFDEDEPVYAHPRDPYHRVDVRESSRHVVVRHGDETIADTRRPKILYETSLPPRHYIPAIDLRTDLLTLSDTISECPYKGDGQHWHLRVPGHPEVRDAAWSLPHPLPEAFTARDYTCFYNDKVQVEVDGVMLH